MHRVWHVFQYVPYWYISAGRGKGRGSGREPKGMLPGPILCQELSGKCHLARGPLPLRKSSNYWPA